MANKKQPGRGRPELPEDDRREAVCFARSSVNERALWTEAAEVVDAKLSEWARDELNKAAKRILKRKG